ncbi:uncharacterized protein LOC108703917 isoform X2 [Xenopus laevis]|uniref:Uncharacterized protein LOC108703917 isoform X2 n=1 Tax=Xenopus laevis TaxID=8355 RepID=A0A8J1LTI4_XENLA|nr:uncharacterized protein LOC108703917 isoform X2 [Xenopus laevis]
MVWQQLLQVYNGRSVWQQLVIYKYIQTRQDQKALELTGHWCTGSWPETWKENGLTKNMVLLELFPLVVTIVVWGKYFAGKRLLFNCDNMGVVLSVNNLSAKSMEVVRLLRHLVLCCLVNNIWVRARHIPGTRNEIADALSRFHFQRFRELAPDADQEGTECPEHLWGLILPDFARLSETLRNSVAESTWCCYVKSWSRWSRFLLGFEEPDNLPQEQCSPWDTLTFSFAVSLSRRQTQPGTEVPITDQRVALTASYETQDDDSSEEEETESDSSEEEEEKEEEEHTYEHVLYKNKKLRLILDGDKVKKHHWADSK